MPQSGVCCKCCFKLIFTLGLACLSTWLYLRADDPKCTIQYFYLPALNKTLDTPTNSTLIFELKLGNGNKNKGIYYDDLNLTFYDNPNSSQPDHLIGNYNIPGFYQGYNKKALKGGAVEVNRTLVFQAVFPNGSAVFRVELATEIRFKIVVLKIKRKKLVRGANVEVNDQGANVNQKGIRLQSGAPQHGCRCAPVVGVLFGLMVLFFLNFR